MNNSYEKVLSNLKENGIHIFGNTLNSGEASSLFQEAMSIKKIGSGIFLSEADYLANPQHKKVNPGKGKNNFLEQFDKSLDFVEQDKVLVPIIEKLLGNDYEILLKKFVCGVPYSWIPDWLKERMENSPNNNLGAYIKPEYRDITYFHGIDFHQDCIDWPSGRDGVQASDVLTMYVYIHDVTKFDAPLYALPKTHSFGATIFPHKLERLEGSNQWKYTDDRGRSLIADCIMLTGEAGYVALWHSATLHGTQGINKFDESDRMRLSLRYLLRRSQTATDVGIDDVNKSVDGLLALESTRRDLDKEGKIAIKHSSISKLNND